MKYTTRQECIDREIIVAIEASGVATRDEYDLERIADEVIVTDGASFHIGCAAEEFWTAVEAAARGSK